MVLGLTVLKMNGIDGGWTNASMQVDLLWIATWAMFKQLGTKGTWCQSKHGSEFM
jgi:hypothetical protein